jgi:hypothetical protein
VIGVVALFTPHIERESPSVPGDGYLGVYLPDGTGFVVNSRHLLRLDPQRAG